jgi:3-deoxy-7-phosphoheptulonate synthase
MSVTYDSPTSVVDVDHDEAFVTPRYGQASNSFFGTSRLAVIAGPCSVESRQQILDAAYAVRDAGGSALRGGAFKPRTDPRSFQGMKEKGLELLADAREATGLAIVTEVLDTRHVDLVAQYADVLQIGTRNMQNFELVKAAGESGKPVLLKRGMAATIEEWIKAADYVLLTGNRQIILCERGIRTFEDHVRNTLPLTTVPYLRTVTDLKVFVDPSHGTGRADLVIPMARAAVAAGADGLIVEVHPDPAHALTDGKQSLSPTAFEQLMRECRRIAKAMDREI